MMKLINMLKKDENTISIGRLCAVLSFLLFVGISLYLAVLGKSWDNYEAFSASCVVYLLAQLGNKAVEIRGVKCSEKIN